MHPTMLHAQADLWQHGAATFAALFMEGETRSPDNDVDRTDVLTYAVINRGLLLVTDLPRATAPVLAVHGGAGRIVPEKFGAQRVAAARGGLGQSLAAGMTVLHDGGSALDAVIAAVAVLEDDEQFNAGN